MPIKNPPDEIQIELTVLHKYCIIMVNFNETANCTHNLIMNSNNFLTDFEDSLSDLLKINTERIHNLTALYYDTDISKVVVESEDPILDDDIRPENKTYLIMSEKARLSFLLKDYKKYEDEKLETIVLFYILSNMAMETTPMKIENHKAILTEVNAI